MTTLTKVFVILVCLFAFTFTPTAILFASRTYDWKTLAERSQDYAESALAHERSALAIAASEAEHYKALSKQDQDRFRAAQDEIKRLQSQVEQVTKERDEFRLSQQNFESAATRLTAEMQIINGLNQELTTAKERLTQSELKLQDENRRLGDEVNRLSAEKVVLQQQLNQKVEENVAYRNENEQLRGMLKLSPGSRIPPATETPTAMPVAPAAAVPIRGTVTEVRGALATIDVGSASGIQAGLIVVVLREAAGKKQYICDLKITAQIEPNEAVGEVCTTAEGGPRIRPGDQVIDEGSFNSR